jgi:hypothetical protein
MNLSPRFRHLAVEASQRAVADLPNPNYGKHLGRDRREMTHTPHAAESVIMSVTALEAGINEMAVWIRFGFAAPCSPLPDDFMNQRVSDKWCLVSTAMVGRFLDRGAQPWQDFSALVGLRDALVHSRWHHEQVPNFMRSLQSRDLTIPEDPSIYWVDAALTDRVATWAVTTCDRMFAAHAELIGQTDPSSWPWM